MPISGQLGIAGLIGFLSDLIEIAIACAAVYGFLKRKRIKQWFRKADFHDTGKAFDVPEEMVDAVILPVSRREQPEWIIRFLRPKKVALIYTKDRKDIALQLVRDFKDVSKFIPSEDGIEASEYMLSNPDDPVETKRLAKLFINNFREEFPPDRIFVDTTGGKVPMTIGVFQAAEEENVSSIYVIGTFQDPKLGPIIKDPDNKSHGIPIFMSHKTGAL